MKRTRPRRTPSTIRRERPARYSPRRTALSLPSARRAARSLLPGWTPRMRYPRAVATISRARSDGEKLTSTCPPPVTQYLYASRLRRDGAPAALVIARAVRPTRSFAPRPRLVTRPLRGRQRAPVTADPPPPATPVD